MAAPSPIGAERQLTPYGCIGPPPLRPSPGRREIGNSCLFVSTRKSNTAPTWYTSLLTTPRSSGWWAANCWNSRRNRSCSAGASSLRPPWQRSRCPTSLWNQKKMIQAKQLPQLLQLPVAPLVECKFNTNTHTHKKATNQLLFAYIRPSRQHFKLDCHRVFAPIMFMVNSIECSLKPGATSQKQHQT